MLAIINEHDYLAMTDNTSVSGLPSLIYKLRTVNCTWFDN